ncbi:MAG: hypothetical protein U0Q16_08715 [Bryobacteraceae bacterium]
MNLWLRQLLAVFRLEIGKSFLSKRGAWIYLLALVPLLIVGGHALESKWRRARRASGGDAAVTRAKIAQIRIGMTKDEVRAIMPDPQPVYSQQTRRGFREGFRYEGHDAGVTVHFLEGKVSRIRPDLGCDFTQDLTIYASIFQFFYLRLAIFFGCVFVFLNLFRGEMLDKSLHYYFLAPVRREVVVLGKYLAGLAATAVIFCTSTALQLWIYYGHFEAPVLEDYLANGRGWQQAATYVGTTALACAGYGAVFLAAGVLMRNPLVPAAVMLIWEWINGILPLTLRRFSVIYYLKSLCPVEIPAGQDVPPPLALLALNVENAAPWVAILGLLAVAAALVAFSAYRSRRLEIAYGAE